MQKRPKAPAEYEIDVTSASVNIGDTILIWSSGGSVSDVSTSLVIDHDGYDGGYLKMFLVESQGTANISTSSTADIIHTGRKGVKDIVNIEPDEVSEKEPAKKIGRFSDHDDVTHNDFQDYQDRDHSDHQDYDDESHTDTYQDVDRSHVDHDDHNDFIDAWNDWGDSFNDHTDWGDYTDVSHTDWSDYEDEPHEDQCTYTDVTGEDSSSHNDHGDYDDHPHYDHTDDNHADNYGGVDRDHMDGIQHEDHYDGWYQDWEDYEDQPYGDHGDHNDRGTEEETYEDQPHGDHEDHNDWSDYTDIDHGDFEDCESGEHLDSSTHNDTKHADESTHDDFTDNEYTDDTDEFKHGDWDDYDDSPYDDRSNYSDDDHEDWNDYNDNPHADYGTHNDRAHSDTSDTFHDVIHADNDIYVENKIHVGSLIVEWDEAASYDASEPSWTFTGKANELYSYTGSNVGRMIHQVEEKGELERVTNCTVEHDTIDFSLDMIESPTNLTAEPDEFNDIVLSWECISDPSHFVIYRKKEGKRYSTTYRTDGSNRTFRDTDVASDINYIYQIQGATGTNSDYTLNKDSVSVEIGDVVAIYDDGSISGVEHETVLNDITNSGGHFKAFIIKEAGTVDISTSGNPEVIHRGRAEVDGVASYNVTVSQQDDELSLIEDGLNPGDIVFQYSTNDAGDEQGYWSFSGEMRSLYTQEKSLADRRVSQVYTDGDISRTDNGVTIAVLDINLYPVTGLDEMYGNSSNEAEATPSFPYIGVR